VAFPSGGIASGCGSCDGGGSFPLGNCRFLGSRT
jgi:hypothetical protein